MARSRVSSSRGCSAQRPPPPDGLQQGPPGPDARHSSRKHFAAGRIRSRGEFEVLIRTGPGQDAEAQFQEPRERAVVFSRGDALRFTLAGLAIVALLSTGVAGNLAPSDPGLSEGNVAPYTVRAPRDAQIADMARTQAERELAANAVSPRYDWTPDQAASEAA